MCYLCWNSPPKQYGWARNSKEALQCECRKTMKQYRHLLSGYEWSNKFWVAFIPNCFKYTATNNMRVIYSVLVGKIQITERETKNETINEISSYIFSFIVWVFRQYKLQITNEKRMPVASKKKGRKGNAYDKRKTEEKKNHFKRQSINFRSKIMNFRSKSNNHVLIVMK